MPIPARSGRSAEGAGGRSRDERETLVTFFWPFSGDYWILALGADYEYAVVGTPDRKYLWFLARTPTIGDDLYGRLVDMARERGFDPARIERSVR